jgi:hypothetical protein
MIFLDKYGWPVETFKGRPVLNFLRRLIHTRKIVRRWQVPAFLATRLMTGVEAREKYPPPSREISP